MGRELWALAHLVEVCRVVAYILKDLGPNFRRDRFHMMRRVTAAISKLCRCTTHYVTDCDDSAEKVVRIRYSIKAEYCLTEIADGKESDRVVQEAGRLIATSANDCERTRLIVRTLQWRSVLALTQV